jgi:hypothetical protein
MAGSAVSDSDDIGDGRGWARVFRLGFCEVTGRDIEGGEGRGVRGDGCGTAGKNYTAIRLTICVVHIYKRD